MTRVCYLQCPPNIRVSRFDVNWQVVPCSRSRPPSGTTPARSRSPTTTLTQPGTRDPRLTTRASSAAQILHTRLSPPDSDVLPVGPHNHRDACGAVLLNSFPCLEVSPELRLSTPGGRRVALGWMLIGAS